MVLPRIIKPKNQRTKRALEKKEPKVFENDKNTLFLRGSKTSEIGTQILKDLYALKKPLGIMYHKKNEIRPFENETSLKRPHNLVMGRMYDGHVLDMIEMGVENFKSLYSFKNDKITLGTKPCLVFSGEAFEQDLEHQRMKSLFIDFFRGAATDNVRLQGLEHVYSFTAVEGKILFRSYKILLKKSGARTPRVELEEMGPSMDLVIRRCKLASADLYKRACRVPKQAKANKKKNIATDALGTKKGRIHMTKQDLSKLQTRKMKGLKEASMDEDDVIESEEEDSVPAKRHKTDSD